MGKGCCPVIFMLLGSMENLGFTLCVIYTRLYSDAKTGNGARFAFQFLALGDQRGGDACVASEPGNVSNNSRSHTEKHVYLTMRPILSLSKYNNGLDPAVIEETCGLDRFLCTQLHLFSQEFSNTIKQKKCRSFLWLFIRGRNCQFQDHFHFKVMNCWINRYENLRIVAQGKGLVFQLRAIHMHSR